MKKLMIILGTIIFCTFFLTGAHAANKVVERPKDMHVQGTIKDIAKNNMMYVETKSGLMEFKYKQNENDDCVQLRDLNKGDNVSVTYRYMKKSMKQKEYLRATCVIKNAVIN